MKNDLSKTQQNLNQSAERKSILSHVNSLRRVFNEGEKESLYNCHRCTKNLPRRYLMSCRQCKMKTCFLCYDDYLKKPISAKDYRECLVCTKKCYCGECRNRRKGIKKGVREHGRYLNTTVTMSTEEVNEKTHN